MSSRDAEAPIALTIDTTDPVGILRYSLERRQFGDAYAIELMAGEFAHRSRHATFYEALSFMETAPEQARDAVLSLLAGLSSA